MNKNWSYTIKEGEHAGKTLWSGRYCAVAAFVFRRIDGIWSVLANKRGAGTPDYQGCWNAVCGYLEANESASQGCSREIFEETGYVIKPEKFLQVYTQTDPEQSEHGNVTLRHLAIIFEHEIEPRQTPKGGEVGEVDEVRWIPIEQVNNYNWAFNHRTTIIDLFYNFISPLTEYTFLVPGEFLMLSNKKWLENNPTVKKMITGKILGNYNIYD